MYNKTQQNKLHPITTIDLGRRSLSPASNGRVKAEDSPPSSKRFVARQAGSLSGGIYHFPNLPVLAQRTLKKGARC